MKIKIIFFGILQEYTGKKQIFLEDVDTAWDARDLLFTMYPKLINSNFQIAYNQKILQSNCNLKNGDVLAFLPPFAGG